MAAKKKSKTPAVRYLRYELTNSGTPGTETSHYIDLAKDLSAINRRLYRQGRRYHVKRVSIVSSNTIAATGWIDYDGLPGTDNITQNAGFVSVSTVPESWVTQKAWQRGFKVWQMMQKKAMAAAGSDYRGTWNDFKVWLTNDMRSGTVLTPKDNGGNNVTAGEWVYSKMQSPDGTTSADEFELHLLGAHQGGAGVRQSVGLVRSFGESRATVQATSPAGAIDADDPLMNLFDDGTVHDEVIQDILDDGDAPPYSAAQYPGGGANHPKPLVVQQTTLGADGRATVGGFSAMCGLLEIEAKSPIAGDVYSVLVELAPGSYRGIAAEVI
jgi:hypothetical protein